MKETANTSATSQTVVIQGLGFVGAAMAVAVASALDNKGRPRFNVVGIDLDNPAGNSRINSINSGVFPFETVDISIIRNTRDCVRRGNLRATADDTEIETADIVLISVNLDIASVNGQEPSIDFTAFRGAVHTLGKRIQPGTLVIVETTVPPGTCVNVVKPLLEEHLSERGIDSESVFIAHSYERVMPGAEYLDSIINFWRVYSGITEEAADRCEAFLAEVINVKDFPLTRLQTTYASETAKVLENSYRAVNIAFMEEWGRFAEDAGFDLFEVINAIRKRPTHSNMRQPGFGVGGYCLTKDPLFARLAARDVLHLEGHDFPFSSQAIRINSEMPLVTLGKLKRHFNGSLAGVKILLMGISYRQDVGDTRYSPAQTFTSAAVGEGALLTFHDPFVKFWEEMQLPVETEIPDADGYDAIVFAVPHHCYGTIDFNKWLGEITNSKCLVFDANNVLDSCQRQTIKKLGHTLLSIGRG